MVELDDDVVLLPGLVDTHVHVNEPGPHRVGGLRHARPGRPPPAASPRSSTCRSTASRRPSTSRALAGQAGRRGRPGATSTWASGAARSPATWPTCAPLHDAGVFGFKCFLLDSGVEEFPPLDAGRAATRRCARSRAFGGLLVVHAEDADSIAARRRAGRAALRAASSRPARAAAEDLAIAAVVDAARRDRRAACTSCTCPAPTRCRCSRRRRARRACRLTVETCPHYLTFDAEDDPRRRDRSSSAARRSARRPTATRLWAGAGRRASSTCVVVRPLAVHRRTSSGSTPATSARPGAGSPRCSSACRRCGPRPGERGHGLADVVRWMADAPRRPGRAAAQGPDRRRRRRRPVRVRAGRDVRGRPRPAAPPAPGHAVRRPDAAPASSARPGWPGARSTSTTSRAGGC